MDTEIVWVLVTVPRVAEIIAQDDIVLTVVNAAVAVSEPAGIETVAGTFSPALVDCRVTVEAVGPAAVRVRVQVPPAPGLIEVGEHASEESE